MGHDLRFFHLLHGDMVVFFHYFFHSRNHFVQKGSEFGRKDVCHDSRSVCCELYTADFYGYYSKRSLLETYEYHEYRYSHVECLGRVFENLAYLIDDNLCLYGSRCATQNGIRTRLSIQNGNRNIDSFSDGMDIGIDTRNNKRFTTTRPRFIWSNGKEIISFSRKKNLFFSKHKSIMRNHDFRYICWMSLSISVVSQHGRMLWYTKPKEIIPTLQEKYSKQNYNGTNYFIEEIKIFLRKKT